MPNDEEKKRIKAEDLMNSITSLSKRIEGIGKKVDGALDTIAHAIPPPSKVEHPSKTEIQAPPKTEYVLPPMNAILTHILEGDQGKPCPNCYPKVEKAILEKHKDHFVPKGQVPSLEGFVKLDDLKAAEFGCKDCGFPVIDPKKVDNCPMCGGKKYGKRK